MASVSTFWTCLVIWIDEDPPQLARIRDYVTWSRDRLIDIYILRRDAPGPRPHTKRDPTEKAHVKAVMDVLSPHVKRWQTLRVRLLHSSSLPLPRVDLVGCADELILLRLSSVIDDTVASIEAAPSLVGEFHAPKLLWLYMGGFPFREVYVKPFPRLPLPPRLDGVYLLEYDSHHPPFPLVDLLSCLASCNGLYKVQLANLKLDCSYTGPPILESTMTWDVIDFIDMTGNIISEYNRLLDYSYAEMASYTRCSMDTPAQLGDSYVISMEGIVNAMTLFSLLAGAQGQDSCRRAWFISCDGLCSEIIRALAMPIPTPLGEFWVCRYLKGLTIVGCTPSGNPPCANVARIGAKSPRRACRCERLVNRCECLPNKLKYVHVHTRRELVCTSDVLFSFDYNTQSICTNVQVQTTRLALFHCYRSFTYVQQPRTRSVAVSECSRLPCPRAHQISCLPTLELSCLPASPSTFPFVRVRARDPPVGCIFMRGIRPACPWSAHVSTVLIDVCAVRTVSSLAPRLTRPPLTFTRPSKFVHAHPSPAHPPVC
ncbi:uncharacterized protein B0H18DRAFT_380973 [Fomitopsis serialis]|uniref:uncharacterized protein n=1 Tax=Fomitopsis serialis TaxID=139415 RepID=UPI0020084BD1|nr:uncharacterized protein B0H18DRAFT_380973 [Neoantrodia serialis]KAH9925214.1 hypothetical protein B0H18DRAFT_380973 [Neoantrodia serialis]